MKTRHALAASLLALAANLPLTAMAGNYSAETLRAAPGVPPQSGKIYVSEQAIRTDSDIGGRKLIEIISHADGVMRTIMPDDGIYMERKLEASQLPPVDPPEAPCKPAPQLTCAKVGDTEINGMKAERWDITPAGAPAAKRVWWDASRKLPLREEYVDGRVMQATLRSKETYEGSPVESWEFAYMAPDGTYTRTVSLYSAELGIPVRTQQQNGFLVQLTKIKTGAPDAALFEVPDGLRKIEPGQPPMTPNAMAPQPAPPPAAHGNQAPAQPKTQQAAPAKSEPETP